MYPKPSLIQPKAYCLDTRPPPPPRGTCTNPFSLPSSCKALGKMAASHSASTLLPGLGWDPGDLLRMTRLHLETHRCEHVSFGRTEGTRSNKGGANAGEVTAFDVLNHFSTNTQATWGPTRLRLPPVTVPHVAQSDLLTSL